MKSVRVEEDLIGMLDIPADALYGIHTVRTVRNLSFSGKLLAHYPVYIQALATVKKAAVLANYEAGVLSCSKKDAIISACDELLANRHYDQFIIDVLHGGGGIGTNMNTNEVISNLANEKLGGGKGKYDLIHYSDDVNASQSTSDVCHTAIRMAIIHSFSHFSNELIKSVDAMARLADKFQNIETISRTCLQDGMRVQLGETFRSYETMIKRRLQGIDQAISQLYQINLGGTVIGSGIGAPQAYQDIIVEKLREVSNLPLFHRENLYDAAQNIDDLGAVSRELSLLASCFIKIAKDLRLRSSGPEAGFSELVLPAVQAGSSFFPGKVNPTIPETLIQCCFQVLGCDRTVQAALEHAELDLNVFEGIAGINILDALGMLQKAVSHFTDQCLLGIEANQPRCQELAGSFIPTVVELKEQLGYSAVSKLIKEKGKSEIKRMVNQVPGISNGGEGNVSTIK